MILIHPKIKIMATISHLPPFFRYLRRGSPESGFSLFEDESLRWPGFVEFDDVNSKVMTFSVDEKYVFIITILFFLFSRFSSYFSNFLLSSLKKVQDLGFGQL